MVRLRLLITWDVEAHPCVQAGRWPLLARGLAVYSGVRVLAIIFKPSS